ncbi:hypothetical protein [Deferrisoma camini]|uniref:hypothetical protein n=1 Tax=Deferrisoma camini TaxID=1035120 RepID=UPI00046D2338|nr:hypothetical protein [Deferrisoma camini]
MTDPTQPGAAAAPSPEPPQAEEEPAGIDAATADDEAVSEAATRPAQGPQGPGAEPERDRTFLLAVVLVAVMLVFLWIGGTALWGMRRQISGLQARLDRVEASLADETRARNRAALGRIRADLRALRETLPPELAERVDRAAKALSGVESEL